jgi:hypothetical protein
MAASEKDWAGASASDRLRFSPARHKRAEMSLARLTGLIPA